MKDVLNFAIVGCGVIGEDHAKAINELSEAKLAAICDKSEKNLQKMEKTYSVDAYSDYNEMFKRDDIDVVSISTPSGTHAGIGIAAAKAGKHIIVEKPIDITLEKADALINACRESEVKLCCIFQSRFDKAIVELKKAVDEGKLGQLNFGACHTKWYRSQEYYDSAGWRGTWQLDGGGALMNQSIHYIDLLQYMMGPVDEVFGYCVTRAHERMEVEDIGIATLKFKSGAVGIIEGNTTVYPGFGTRLDVYGNDGSVVIENRSIKEWKLKSGEEYQSVLTEGQGGQETPVSMAARGTHKVQIKDMIDAIKEDREPMVNGDEGRKSLEIILAIYKSAAEGRAVKL